jgi:hypothetical protein
MRFGLSWRVTVFASLLLLLSGQVCMLTTCLPRMARAHAAAHACCHTEPTSPTPTPAPTGAMPCGQSVVLLDAGSHDVAPPIVQAIAWLVAPLAVPTPVVRAFAFATRDNGPPLDRSQPATAGLRAPPQG